MDFVFRHEKTNHDTKHDSEYTRVMSWTGVVWRASGNYGPRGRFEAQKDLGRRTFPNEPEPGMILEVAGEDYRVVSVGLGSCHVRPMRMKSFP